MKISRYLRRIVAGDKVVDDGIMSVRNAVVWLFIALVALFLTNPAGEPRSVYDRPLPMPPGLSLDVPGLHYP